MRSVECEVWSVKFEVWSAKSAVCSVRCGVSREGHGRDRLSLNYRSFMFGKLPPPACPGLCYIIFFRDVCSGGGMVASINHSIPPHKSNAQAVVLVPRFEKFATGSMAGQSKVHDAVAVLLGATSSAEVQDPAESFLEDVLEMVPSHISPWSWVVNLSPQDQRPRPLMRLSSSYINLWGRTLCITMWICPEMGCARYNSSEWGKSWLKQSPFDII